MEHPKMIRILIIATIMLVNIMVQTSAAPLIMWYYYCINTTGTYEEFDMYHANLNTLISSIASSTHIEGGFYNISLGDQGIDQVNAIGQCRGDLNSETCLSCLSDAVYKLPDKCPTQKEAIGWYDDCMLHYTNRTIFHLMETTPSTCLTNVYNVSDVELLNRTRAGLFSTLKDKSIRTTGSIPYYSTGHANATGNSMTVYGMMQCTPDITPENCSDCLDTAIGQLQKCSYGNRGGRVLTPSCSVRYETAPFINSSKTPSSQPPTRSVSLSPPKTPRSKKKKKNKSTVVIISAVFSSFGTIAIAAIIYYCTATRRNKSIKQLQDDSDISTVDSLQFDFGTIKTATSNFSLDNRLGQGGFGAVYKGILPNGQEVAVKRLGTNSNSGQGEVEFKNEILLLAKLQHRNLVRLLGFCLDKEERLLIYEYVPNASLDKFLFDPVRQEVLDWQKRTKIINGIARGILYLHEDSRLRIIHRDLKASNILLDKEMNAKIADFGLAKLILADQTHADTSRIAGTFGYMAPEYAMHGLFSVKSDVYSFGIMLLEIICGRRNAGYDTEQNAISIVTLVWRNWREGTISKVIDPTLLRMESSSGSEITRYTHIALLCIQEKESDRPTMASIVVMLSTASLSLPVPSLPGFEQITMPQHGYLFEYDQSYSSQSTTVTLSINEESVTKPFFR